MNHLMLITKFNKGNKLHTFIVWQYNYFTLLDSLARYNFSNLIFSLFLAMWNRNQFLPCTNQLINQMVINKCNLGFKKVDLVSIPTPWFGFSNKMQPSIRFTWVVECFQHVFREEFCGWCFSWFRVFTFSF